MDIESPLRGEVKMNRDKAGECALGRSNTLIKRKRKLFNFKSNFELLILSIPAVILLIAFNYIPMFGIIVAFKDYRYDKGFWGSEWAGLKNFDFFFTSQDAWRVTRNTLGLNALFIIVGISVSIAFAIMLNEITKRIFVKFYQTTMFFPYFLSWVVVSYMLFAFLNEKYGMLSSLLRDIGIETPSWYTEPAYWPAILVLAYIWKNVGYYSIIFYAGIMGIENEYYEAAAIDGATKTQMIRKITIPLLTPLITVITLLQIGRIFYADFGMFYFLPQDIGMLYPVTDVLDTYVYRALRKTGEIGMASAAGFYQAVVGLLLVSATNYLVRKFNKENALF